jgi:hypothetical protein
VGFSRRYLEKNEGNMPYKDPQKQREYLRNWRRNRKCQEIISPPAHTAQRTGQNLPAPHSKVPQPLALMTPSLVDQRALKLSPDGAPQTGREATRAYQLACGQMPAARASPRHAAARKVPTPLGAHTGVYPAMLMASLLVDVLSKALS